MNEGYPRRPEESLISRINARLQKWRSVVSIIGAIALWVTNVGWMTEMRTTQQLRAELAEANRQLGFWTCRVQYEPSPMPEQVGEGPTLLPGEEK